MSAPDLQRVTRDLDVVVTRLSGYFVLARQLADRGHLAAVRSQVRDIEALMPDLEALVGSLYASANPHGFEEDLAPVVDLVDKPKRARAKSRSTS